MKCALFLVTALVCAQNDSIADNNTVRAEVRPESVRGSLQASQGAVDSLEFILRAPRNCLETIVDLKDSVSKNMAALWLRGVFHDAGTWAPTDDNPAGLDSSLLSFLDVPDNAGLADSVATRWVQNPHVSMTAADQIALGAHVSVTHCGGPKMLFRTGRADAVTPTSPIGRVPKGNSTLAEARPAFDRMGWTNEDIVALVTGSHTLGGVHGKNSPDVTSKEFMPFDETAGIFDNNVFKITLQNKCAVQIDCDIANDPELRPIVQRFADDQDAFFQQYVRSFEKLVSQTTSELGPPQDLRISDHVGLYETEQPPLNFDSIGSVPGTKGSSNLAIKSRINQLGAITTFLTGLFSLF